MPDSQDTKKQKEGTLFIIDAALENRVIRRLLLFIMPTVLIAFMDRINVSFAAATMNPAIGIDPQVFGIGAGIFFVGYLLFEIPSNVLMHRVGARIWIPRIMVTWGLVSAGLSLAVGPASFLVIRFLLGVAEAGLIPGLMLYASYWIAPRRLGTFTSLMFVMAPIGGAVTALISGVILKLDGAAGLAGWQWLFILEGLPAILLGIVGFFYLDSRPRDARWLSESEKQQIEASLATISADQTDDTASDRWVVLKNHRMWICAGAYFLMNVALGSQPWLPLLFALFKTSSVETGVILAVANGLAAVSMVFWARRSDKSLERLNHLLIASVVSAVGWFLCGYPAGSLALLSVGATLAVVGLNSAFVVFWTMPSSFLLPRERPVGIAVVTCVGLIGAFLAPVVTGYIKKTTGSYEVGMYLAAVGIILSALMARLAFPATLPRQAAA